MLRPGILAACLILGMGGCGAGSDPKADAAAAESESVAAAEASAAASASAAAIAKAEKAAKREAAETAAWQDCRTAVGDLWDALQQVNSRLNVGLNADELGDRLGDVQVAYDAADFAAMDGKCTLNVGVALESALNEYTKSLNKWNQCIQDYGCTVEGSVLKRLRKHWSEAGERLEHVEKTMATADSYAAKEDWPS